MNTLKYNPLAVVIDQTVLCNEACFFCWRSDNEKVKAAYEDALTAFHLPWEIYKKIIDDCSQYPQLVGMSMCGPMGDPTLVPSLAERAIYARKHFKTVLMNTNGVALDKHDPSELIKGFTKINISLDTVREDTYKEIHGKDHLIKVLKNVFVLIKANQKATNPIKIGLKFTENKHNKGQLGSVRKWLVETGLAGDKNHTVNPKEIHSFIDVQPDITSKHGAKLCNQPYSTINFNYKGEITTCCINYKCDPVFGSIEENTLKQLWESKDFEDWRKSRLTALCEGCSGLPGNRVTKGLAKTSLSEYENFGEQEYNTKYPYGKA